MTAGRKPLYSEEILLDNGERYTVKEIMDVTGKSRSVINTRLSKNNHAYSVLSRGNAHKAITLSDGKMYTMPEIVEITGCTDKTIGNRLHRSKEASYILKKNSHYNYTPSKRNGVPLNAFNETYGETDEKVFKLLFGKW
jgi:DNA-directed RNA polymerase specialized sigma24 family protein